MKPTASWQLGVDIGGTYVDIVALREDGSLRTGKRPYPAGAGQATATLSAIRNFMQTEAIEAGEISRILHGTTLVTNVLLERREQPVGIITNAGFEDILAIGRQNRNDLYSMAPVSTTPLDIFPDALRAGIAGRISADGTEIEPVNSTNIIRAVRKLAESDVSAIAVCLLHSTTCPDHELKVRDIITHHCPDLKISVSHEIDNAPGEYERFLATALDAYIKPMTQTYLQELASGFASAGLPVPEIITSDATVITAEAASEMPLRLAMSGPAAALRGFEALSRLAESPGNPVTITLETGGTTSDIGLIREGELAHDRHLDIGALSVRQRTVDIGSTAIGGGSILRVNDAGALRVGPDSAGSVPGPASFGRGGTRPTLTDALVLLGRLPDSLAGGIELDRPAAAEAMETIARALGCSAQIAAEAAIAAAATAIAEAIKTHAFQRGIDPAETILMVGGGGGGQHAAEAAELAGINQALILAQAAIISAVGCLACHPVEATEQSMLVELDNDSFEALRIHSVEMADKLTGTGLPRWFLDIAYRGQQSPLEVSFEPLTDSFDDISKRFAGIHETRRGHADGTSAVVHRLRAEKTTPGSLQKVAVSPPDHTNRASETPVTGFGPQSLFSDRTSIWVPQGWQWRKLSNGDILLSQERLAA